MILSHLELAELGSAILLLDVLPSSVLCTLAVGLGLVLPVVDSRLGSGRHTATASEPGPNGHSEATEIIVNRDYHDAEEIDSPMLVGEVERRIARSI